MEEINPANISIDKISVPLFVKKEVEVAVLRLDKIHPQVSGNKWFKLRYYLEDAKKENKKTILTFGGAWSNHILATAAACRIHQLECIGIIRGEKPAELSDTLLQARESGMKLFFVSREDYPHQTIPQQFHQEDYYLIREGGYGMKGATGAATILDHCNKEEYTHICCAVGTGTMMAGLIRGAAQSNAIIGISVLKNNLDLEGNIKLLLGDQPADPTIIHDYHFGGYAKYKPGLIEFMNEYYSQTNIPSDFVYTGKLFFAVNDLVENNYFQPGSRLLIVHSGGLQGNNSLKKGTLIF